ncbi:hypothetical protein [Flavobacterium suncheonense]|uniref:hypothetical protein n=1 Tax=Flavobacterium suncheonense TaxID=350894 RepID=UPI0012B62758|nr:hypothetical protein [Flavobacterium suncheonense]
MIDKAVELTGDAESAILMSFLNQISVTDSLSIGTQLKKTEIKDYDVVDFFSIVKPATALSPKLYEYELPGEFPFSF